MKFIEEDKDRTDGGRRWGVEPICRVLTQQGVKIAPATYYAAKAGPPSLRAVRDAAFKAGIADVHATNDDAYGAVKMQRALQRERAS